MVHATHPARAFETTWLGQLLLRRWPQVGDRLSLHRQYCATLAELSALTDRELADIGMARADLAAIAREHVYG